MLQACHKHVQACYKDLYILFSPGCLPVLLVPHDLTLRLLQQCYGVLKECYKGIIRFLQECCKSVSRVLQECYQGIRTQATET
jgi:hypothetical protein